MKRREFITLLGGAAAWPLAARGQEAERIRLIGVLRGTAADDPESQARSAAFRQGLQELGWTEGRNLRIDTRRDLPTSDGQPDRWMRDQSGIGRVARDDIAKEVVALSNAYGGAVIIGIDETDDHPKRAKQLASPQIPRVVDCAGQIARALQSIIDPPLPMLEVRGIASSVSGEGAILIRVGASPSAPHGFGTPPATYVRHGSQSVPLSMRELQSMFFERRTRLERIESRRRQFSAAVQELWAIRSEGRLAKIKGHRESTFS